MYVTYMTHTPLTGTHLISLLPTANGKGCSYTSGLQDSAQFIPGSDGGMWVNHTRSPGQYKGNVAVETLKGPDLIM